MYRALVQLQDSQQVSLSEDELHHLIRVVLVQIGLSER